MPAVAGLYVACWLSPDDAAKIWSDGEPAASLHLTLAYLGDVDELPDDAAAYAQAAVAGVAFRQAPLAGTIAGVGVFRATDQDCIVALPDIVGLNAFRERVCSALTNAGLPPQSEHGFLPHITIAYTPAGQTIAIPPTDPVTIRLDSVSVITPSSEERLDIPLVGVAKEQPTEAAVHVDRPLGSEPKRKPKRPGDDELEVAVIKADDEKQIVGGIVLQPVVADSQGDVVRPEEIEDAAHRFLYNRTPIGIQHRDLAPDDVRPVESYLAPVDFIADTPRGPELVRKGSWIVAVHIPDEHLWRQVKTDGFSGWSIAGTGRRTPLTV
jgi:2'-5' RNA ligase